MTLNELVNNSRLQRVVVLMTAAAVIVFWGVLAQYRFAKAALGETRTGVPSSYLLNGMRVPLDGSTKVEASWRPASFTKPSADTRRLLIVTSDNCPWSVKSVTAWTQLLKTLTFQPGDEVVVLTSGDEVSGKLAEVLRSAGVAYRVLSRSSVEGLVHAAGINSTPFTIALDHDDRVRLIVRSLGERQTALLRAFFAR
jgi:hypothetical protein